MQRPFAAEWMDGWEAFRVSHAEDTGHEALRARDSDRLQSQIKPCARVAGNDSALGPPLSTYTGSDSTLPPKVPVQATPGCAGTLPLQVLRGGRGGAKSACDKICTTIHQICVHVHDGCQCPVLALTIPCPSKGPVHQTPLHAPPKVQKWQRKRWAGESFICRGGGGRVPRRTPTHVSVQSGETLTSG